MRQSSIILALLVSAALAAAAPAAAVVSRAQIDKVEASPAPGAMLPLDIDFADETGRTQKLREALGGLPSVLLFVDYTCRTLCGPILEFASAGLAKTGLKPGVDFRLIAIGIDPRDNLAAARAMRAGHLDSGSGISRAATFLTGDETAIRAVTQAAGLHYYYDADHDQYAHPAAVYISDGEGRLQRVLSPLGLDGADLRLAIVDAGRGSVGTLADRIHLFCYGYDPVNGIYTERITSMLAIAAGMTLAMLFGGIFLMTIRDKRKLTS
jgi:protein SCO1/2